MSRMYASGLVLLVALTLAACGGSPSTSSSAATASPSPVAVAIAGYAFSPAKITVAPGTRITFTNHDQTSHTATSNAPGFDTGTVSAGASASVVLRKPGVYSYYCQFHAFMRGTIVVR